MQAADLHADVIGLFTGFRLFVEEHYIIARPDGEAVKVRPWISPLRRLPGQLKIKSDSGNAERRGAIGIIPLPQKFCLDRDDS